MRRFCRGGALCLIALFLVTACGDDIKEGTVIEKWIEPESTTTIFIPITIACGKNCNTVLFVPFTQHDDEDWVLRVENTDEKGKVHRGKIYVSPTVYESIKIGDFYAKQYGDATKDPKTRQRK